MTDDEIMGSVTVYTAATYLAGETQKHNPIKPGLMIITEGMYSDYSVHGVFRVLRQIDDPDAIEKRFIYVDHIPATDKFSASSYTSLHCTEMIAYLVKEGFIEEVAHHEWHLA